MKSHLIPLGT